MAPEHTPRPEEDRADRFAIVGAGFCGLGIAAAFQRAGIPFDVLEASDDVGGNWYQGVYDCVHIITSRRTTAYPDYPMPESWPDFPSGKQVLEYLRAYCDHHRLRRSIELRSRVARAEPLPGGAWRVALEGGAARRYRGLVVASGHHWERRWPSYPGAFAGEVLHARDYRSPEIFRGKRVLVVGGGNSACDIAVEAARAAGSAHVAVRSGSWMLPKTVAGRPTMELLRPWMPELLQRALLRGVARLTVGRHEHYGLPPPRHGIFERNITVDTQLLHFIRHGRVVPHPDVARYDGASVEFVDGARQPFDVVVCATGYHVTVPFLPEGTVTFRHGVPQLVDGIFHPEHPNLYLFGFTQSRYGSGPLVAAGAAMLCTVIEAQRRLAAPLGAILQRLGRRPPSQEVRSPFDILRGARRLQWLAPRLPRLEPFIMR